MCEFLWTNCEHLKKKKCQHLSGCTGIFQYSVLNFITCAIKQSSCEPGSYQHLNLIQSTLSLKTLVLCDYKCSSIYKLFIYSKGVTDPFPLAVVKIKEKIVWF